MTIDFDFAFSNIIELLILLIIPVVIIYYCARSKKKYLATSELILKSMNGENKKTEIDYASPNSYNMIVEEFPNAYFSIILSVITSSTCLKQYWGTVLFAILLLINCSIYSNSVNLLPSEKVNIEKFHKEVKPLIKKSQREIIGFGIFLLISIFVCCFMSISLK